MAVISHCWFKKGSCQLLVESIESMCTLYQLSCLGDLSLPRKLTVHAQNDLNSVAWAIKPQIKQTRLLRFVWAIVSANVISSLSCMLRLVCSIRHCYPMSCCTANLIILCTQQRIGMHIRSLITVFVFSMQKRLVLHSMAVDSAARDYWSHYQDVHATTDWSVSLFWIHLFCFLCLDSCYFIDYDLNF